MQKITEHTQKVKVKVRLLQKEQSDPWPWPSLFAIAIVNYFSKTNLLKFLDWFTETSLGVPNMQGNYGNAVYLIMYEAVWKLQSIG